MTECDANRRLPSSQAFAYAPAASCRPRSGLTTFGSLLFGIVAVAVAGCGVSSDPASILVDPGAYSEFNCKDLVTRRAALMQRAQQLRDLQAKASAGTGGALIGTLSYRTQYETTMEDLKILERVAKAQNCALVTTYQSDQTIH